MTLEVIVGLTVPLISFSGLKMIVIKFMRVAAAIEAVAGRPIARTFGSLES